jgi:hypothetical protein
VLLANFGSFIAKQLIFFSYLGENETIQLHHGAEGNEFLQDIPLYNLHTRAHGVQLYLFLCYSYDSEALVYVK